MTQNLPPEIPILAHSWKRRAAAPLAMGGESEQPHTGTISVSYWGNKVWFAGDIGFLYLCKCFWKIQGWRGAGAWWEFNYVLVNILMTISQAIWGKLILAWFERKTKIFIHVVGGLDTIFVISMSESVFCGIMFNHEHLETAEVWQWHTSY